MPKQIMARKRFVDLSIAIEHGLPSDPSMMIPKIDYVDHAGRRRADETVLPGVTSEQFAPRAGWAVEFLTRLHIAAPTSTRRIIIILLWIGGAAP